MSDLRTAPPGATLDVWVRGHPGLTGVGAQVVDQSGTAVGARAAATELVATLYHAQVTAPLVESLRYAIVYDEGGTAISDAAESLLVSASLPQTAGVLVPAGAPTLLVAQNAPGAADAGLTIYTAGGGLYTARASAAELVAGSGVRGIVVTLPAGQYLAVWDNGGSIVGADEVTSGTVSATPPPPPPPVAAGDLMEPLIVLCGQEVSNPARTINYLRNGLIPSQANGYSDSGAALPPILYRLGGATVTFSDPTADRAPWVDLAYPESNDFLGLLVIDIGGFDAPTARAMLQSAGVMGGGVPGPRGRTPRTHGVTATMFARSKAGMDYGRRWLTDLLDNPCGDGGLAVLETRTSAPPPDGSNDQLGYWIEYDVALTDGPHFDADDDWSAYRLGVAFTLNAGNPFLYKQTDELIPSGPLEPADTSSACISFDEWLCGPPLNDPLSVAMAPPPLGIDAPVVLVQATAGAVQGVQIALYDHQPVAGDAPIPGSEVIVPLLVQGSSFLYDASRHLLAYVDAAGASHDGSPFSTTPSGGAVPWLELPRGRDGVYLGVSATAPCSQGENATVTAAIQHREL